MRLTPALSGLVVVGLVGGAFLFYRSAETPSQPRPAPVPDLQGESPPFISPSVEGMRIYRSNLLQFEVKYPEDLTIKEYGKGNTSTIVFEEATGERGFQVFVVPYASTTVSRERFLMDAPSGVMKDPQEIKIDGVSATAFIGKHSLFGDTREVWFIKDGFLYEVNTYQHLDAWLAEIMTTWRFI